nr:uncharacterized protein LOC109158085 [Ipomoea batatas]
MPHPPSLASLPSSESFQPKPSPPCRSTWSPATPSLTAASSPRSVNGDTITNTIIDGGNEWYENTEGHGCFLPKICISAWMFPAARMEQEIGGETPSSSYRRRRRDQRAMRMDVGNGWRPTPAASRDKTIINRMMLRFRPIAPKPAADTASTTTTPASSGSKSKDLVTERPRSKRKYVRVKKMRKRKGIRTQNIGNNNDRRGEEEGKSERMTVLTLQLLPESSNSCNTNFNRSSPNKGSLEKPFLMNFDDTQMGWRDGSGRVVESWVMVDGMTDTWVDGGELGYSDTEKMKNLERDSCPALISDALNRTAKMQSKTMPCDVWKMEFGGLAWRLDAKAALCLGR